MKMFEALRVNAIGYILVGGASSRLGRDKALVEFGLEPLCACWRTHTRSIIEAEFNRGVRKVTEVFKKIEDGDA